MPVRYFKRGEKTFSCSIFLVTVEVLLMSKLPKNIIVADIGGTKMALGHLENGRATTASSSVMTQRLRVADPIAVLEQIILEYAANRQLEFDAVVLGVPVSLDRDMDTVLSGPNIPELEGLKLATLLEAKLSKPVRLERDIVLLTLGEQHSGAAQGSSSTVGVFLGTGVGGGFLIGGKPYRGFSVGMELGHIPMHGRGKICVCGNTDCLEAYACGHTLNALSNQFGISVSELFNSRIKTEELENTLKDFMRDQAFAIAASINLIDPEVCVIGGGIPEMMGFPKDAFKNKILEHLRRPYPREVVKLAWAELGSRATLYGALAVLEERL
jgi:allose kinase